MLLRDRNRARRIASGDDREYNLEYLKQYKLARGCSMCRYNNCASALHFHHVDPSNKIYNIATMTSQGMNLQIIEEEIEKCIILCSNCHAELHFCSD